MGSNLINLTEQNISDTIRNNKLVIVDFWASWCGPCIRFAPIFEKVSTKHPDIIFAKVDTEAEQNIAAQFEIRSIPTLVIFKEKEIIFYQGGALPEEVFEEIIQKARDFDMSQIEK